MEMRSALIMDENMAVAEGAVGDSVQVSEASVQIDVILDDMTNDAEQTAKDEIMRYNDDSVYDEHLNMFLNQSDLEQEVPCVFCNQRFTEQITLKKHIKLMHSKQDLSCPICNRNFKLKNRYELHLRKNHIKSTYFCREK